MDVHVVLIAGREEAQRLDWPTRDSWTTQVSLLPGANELVFFAFDREGDIVGNDTITVTSTAELPPDEFLRGDANGDFSFDISDAVTTLLYLFDSRPIDCLDAADVNDDEVVSIADASYALNALYRGGPMPPAPFPARGVDSTGDGSLDCEE